MPRRLPTRAVTPWRWILPIAAIPAVVAVAQLGRIHPDEVYQTLEPAYARAFGYGILAWEWQVGLRNWAIPIVFSWLLEASVALGLTHPVAYRAVLEVPQLALHALSLAAVYRYTARRVREGLAVWSIPAVGLFAPVITFAGRTMGESFSTAFLLVGIELLDRLPSGDEPSERKRWHLVWALGGTCLGLAVVARYASSVIVAAAMLWLLVARRFRPFALAAAGGLAVAAVLAGIDWATWGKPFHSFFQYIDFNVLSDRAAQAFGAAPFGFYVVPLLLYAPFWAWPGLAWASWRQSPRVSLPLFCALVYFASISVTAHKEHRFLYPALVLLALAAIPGLLGAIERIRRLDLRAAVTSLVLCTSLGPYFVENDLSVQRPDQFQALVKASRGDASGLLIVNEGLWGAGGYFYLGKNIPWYTCDWAHDGAFQAAMRDRRFNRAVTYDERALTELEAGGFQVVEKIGRATILVRPN